MDRITDIISYNEYFLKTQENKAAEAILANIGLQKKINKLRK